MASVAETFKITLIDKNIWSISGQANDQMYLVAGSRKAMLVDTGMGIGDLANQVRKLTSLPLIVVNTHGHPDHAGGNGGFKEAWLHPADEAIMCRMCTDQYRKDDIKAFLGEESPKYTETIKQLIGYRPLPIIPITAGQVFDLGERQFEAVEVPGHTPGSVCLINEKEKILFSGDAIVETPVWLYLGHSMPLKTYRESLIKIREKSFDTILPGHLPAPLDRQILDDLIACASEILADPGRGKPEKTFAGEGLFWQYGRGKIIYDPDNL